MYHLVNVADATLTGGPCELPPELVGLDDEALSDLSWVGAPLDAIYAGKGYWPLKGNDAIFDPDSETLADPALAVDAVRRVVTASRAARPLTSEEMEPLRAQRRAAVMVKRDQVIDGGFTFNGVVFQTSATDRENISGAAQMAFMALLAGGKLPGDLRWHDGAEDFGWIALDNTVVSMDAPTVIDFAKAVAGFKSACIFYARYLKDQIDTAVNPAAIEIETGWPS